METAFHNSTTSSSRGQNGNCTSFAWDNNIHWELGTTTTPNDLRHNWNSLHNHSAASTEASTYHALLYSQGNHMHASALYGGGSGGVHPHPDPHLMCLKLGKRNYFEDATGRHVAGFSISKRGKTYYGDGDVGGEGAVTVAIPAAVPRCQVEGCHVALLNAKDYHRRHKVCEVHSKAPKVVVLGLEQRFCQQCSRFHLVTEFDDSKRSCRRRLAGHNERRRKSSHENPTLPKNNIPSQGRALSLLSSRIHESSIASPDLSSRCSAALRELIAENRAALLARQLVVDKDFPFNHRTMEDQNLHQNDDDNQHHMFNDPQGWDRFDEPGTNNVTLDLMQAPTSAFELLSMRGKSKEEEECSQLWSSFGGTNVI